MNHRPLPAARPPLWLAAAAVTAVWGALYDVVQWVDLYRGNAVHEDFATFYAAAEAGLRYGWARMYDLDTMRALTAGFPGGSNYISSAQLFVNPPVFAWLVAPFTALPIPAAYLLWALLSLAALVWAWQISAPYYGVAKFTMLMVALAIWPVLNTFFYGQPSILILALVATAWWLCAREQPLAAGAALALATAIKPQAMILVPVALLVSGRYRLFAAWAVGSALLAIACAVALGSSGLTSWWHALNYLQSNPVHSRMTLAYVFGDGPLTHALQILQAVAAMVVARRHRARPDVVFAVGLLASLMFSFHLHQPDYTSLVLAAWLVLRTSPPIWHRLWLLIGIATMQVLTLGQPIPQLLWDVAWLAIIAFGPIGRASTVPTTRPGAVSAGGVGT